MLILTMTITNLEGRSYLIAKYSGQWRMHIRNRCVNLPFKFELLDAWGVLATRQAGSHASHRLCAHHADCSDPIRCRGNF